MQFHHGLTAILFALCAAPLTSQNEILYYKFDEAGGSKVINFAPATSPAPEEGTITTNDTSGFAPGRFGRSSLRGGGGGFSTFVETGWNGAFTGDFSLAFFLKHRNAPTSATYLTGNSVGLGFRVFTSGVAARGLRVANWGGTPANLDLTKDLQTMVQANWVHVALVVDSSRGTATWYLDGVAETPITITSGANVPAGPGFRVGAQLTPSSTFDLDEFRFVNRAAAPREVLVWSLQSEAADSPFGAGCGATLSSVSGPPGLGNASYALQFTAAASQPFVLAIGASRTDLSGVPLPFDLGAIFPALPSCFWQTSIALVFGGATDGSGNALQPLPIPNDLSLATASLYVQALVLRLGSEQASNPFAISIGG